MPLKGDLETFNLPNILQLLSEEEKTGVLQVVCKEDAVKVFVLDGTIIYATKSSSKNRLGEFLQKKGMISDKQLEECLELSSKKDLSLGKILLEKGYVTTDVLRQAIFEQAENAVYDMFFWEKAKFAYKDVSLNTTGMLVHKIDIARLVLEATRRIDEMSVFKKQIPSDELIFRLSGKVQDDKAVVFNPEEWRILSLIDGKASVRDIINESMCDIFSVYKILSSLISSGYVVPGDILPPLQRAKKAFAQLSGVDSKKIRKDLDALGLSRSSVLRLILNRIARDSVDAEALAASVEREAVKIINSDEIGFLRKMRDEHQIPYLDEIIALLLERVDKTDSGGEPS